jgi:hypothetical protein
MSRLNWLRATKYVLVAATLFAVAVPVRADVSVTTSGNVATALIDLPSAAAPQYSAIVTITFDSVVNLTPGSLNLTASIVSPSSITGLPAGVAIDPNFPVVVSIEPPVALFQNSFESGETGDGNLFFLNTYELEIHTTNLTCSSSTSQYRLYKAPHGSNAFADITSNLYAGSVRARGRGGAFSQFTIVNDPQLALLVAINKTLALVARTVQAGITGPLLTLVGSILGDLLPLPNLPAAISAVVTFINGITTAAGITIANEWTAGGTLVNDAGEILSIAQTLLFTLNGLNGASVCTLPPT